MTEVELTILAPASRVEECRTLAAYFPRGVGMFLVPVYTAGTATIAYYISTGRIDKVIADALDNPAEFAQQVGADPEYISGLRDEMIVSDDHYDIVLADYNLSLAPVMEEEG